MMTFSKDEFKQQTIELSKIFLDPNNPRFLEINLENYVVPENRISEVKVQEEALKKMQMSSFDVSSLRDNILEVGFLPIDRIVVRPIRGEIDKYVVIEGNRRIAALKSIINLDSIGKVTLSDEQRNSIMHIDVLVVDNTDRENLYSMFIPGIRHISGVKSWGAYQKAVLINKLVKDQVPDEEISGMLGISKATVKLSKRSFGLFELANSLEDDTEVSFAPKDYSYFEEAMKSPNIRKWLEIQDNPFDCENRQNLELLISWMKGEYNETTGENDTPKLSEAKSMRKLSTLLQEDNQKFYQSFISSDKTLEEIDFEIKNSKPNSNWKIALEALKTEFDIMPLITIQSFSEANIALVKETLNVIEEKLALIEKVRDIQNGK